MKPIQMNDAVVEKLQAHRALRERHEAEYEKSHDELWKFVHEQYPELDPDGSFSLKAQFIEAGVVMLVESENDGMSKLKNLLEKVVN
ncbi:hypothetical protein J7384_17220 [Endozoicomonas sp. G2_1]|uniref:hypothetical protein n=1 Tax=Endozoicomonas sp. G2_1 TaxID=2821091 RepID=UPI001AD95D74|nr:hypothetical protein [Endozoicomonas sp. G2_1]MBO9492106.1 hypothetical protein [Endozoicomonas sp. G2_1]